MAAVEGNRGKRVSKKTLGKGAEKAILNQIEMIDNLDRALFEARKDLDVREVGRLIEGLEVIRKSTMSSLNREGVKLIDPLNLQFDPHYHEAEGTVSDPSVPADTVVSVRLKGFIKDGYLIRPSKVTVSKGGPRRGDSTQKAGTHGRGIRNRRIPDFEVVRRIGKGGFAEVFLSKHRLGTYVALKIPQASSIEGDPKRWKMRFLEEAKHWKKLLSNEALVDGIVSIFSYSIEPEPYIAMEYMEGGNLRQRMSELSFDEKLGCITSILNTLYEVHNLGMIHRDIKPENILSGSSGEWKIADWGLSKVLLEGSRKTTEEGDLNATLKYAAPEQIEPDRYGKVDRRTDIYQVGVLSYELFAGRKPFDGSSANVIFSIMKELPPHPCEVDPSLSRHIGDAVMKAITKRKEDRWSDAREFRLALLGKAEERKRDLMVYRKALKQVMVDGRITRDERALLWTLRKTLHISKREHDRMMERFVAEDEEIW